MEDLRIKSEHDNIYCFSWGEPVFIEISSHDGESVGSTYITKQQATELANWLLEAAK